LNDHNKSALISSFKFNSNCSLTELVPSSQPSHISLLQLLPQCRQLSSLPIKRLASSSLGFCCCLPCTLRLAQLRLHECCLALQR
jgi:hypothetical protein